MRIKTHFVYPPIPIRSFDWSAVADETYDGPGSAIGTGATEQEAIDDLLEQLEENNVSTGDKENKVETLHYVRRKEDGSYYSVDGEFTPNKGKAFVFHEGAAMGIGDFLADEYDIIPLTNDEARRFELRADPSFCPEHGTYFVECGDLGHGEDYDPDETL